MKYRALLFDLDGTLTDSGDGITRSVQYALEKMGKPEPDLSKLRVFVGPPLMEQFMSYASLSEEEARQAIVYYRERYTPVGLYENEVYDGVPGMLKTLKDQGYLLAVASSKPTVFVRKVLEHFDLLAFFDVVIGSEMDGRRTEKVEVIEAALQELGMQDRRDKVMMIGDRMHDVEGARKASLPCLAVSYGYGSMEELTGASPAAIVSSPEEVSAFFA